MDSPAQVLSQLLKELFSDDELRRFIASIERDLAAALPGPSASLDMLANEAACVLERRGLLEHALFDQLQTARPHQADAVKAARRRVLPGAPLEPGARWADGSYTLQAQLAVGGFAEVWQAVETATGNHVALKILLPQVSARPSAVDMFHRGASLLSRLHHRGLVHVREPFAREGDRIYCVMDHVPGRTLAEAATDRNTPIDRLLDAILEIGETLAHVHEGGFIHRDVNPNNILVDGQRHAVLIDFDLVGGAAFKPWTTTVPTGTMPYVAPELLDGDEASQATDVYGLAITTLFVLLRGDLKASMVMYDRARLLEQAQIPFAMRAVLQVALERDPVRRTATAAAFCRALEHARQHPDPGPRAPTFAADGSLVLWAPADAPPPALLAAELRLWPAEQVEAHLLENLRNYTDLDRLLRYPALLRVAAVLALRGWRTAFLGLTPQHTPVLVLEGGHLVIHGDGLPEPDDLQLARAHACIPGLPVAVIRGGIPTTRDVVELSRQIREYVYDEPRLRQLERFIKSPEAHDGFDPVVREKDGETTPAIDTLADALATPAVLCLRGILGSGKSHMLRLLAAHLAHEARIAAGPPVVLLDVSGWRPPLRWSALLCERGYTSAEAAAIALAVDAGECVLLIDGLDAPGSPVDLDTLDTEVHGSLPTLSTPQSRVVLTLGPTLSSPGWRSFDLCPLTYTNFSTSRGGALDQRLFHKHGWASLLEVPALAIPLVESPAKNSELPARVTGLLEQYVQSWTTYLARLAPGVTPDDLRDTLEALAADLWFARGGVQGARIPAEALATACPRPDVASMLVDGALLTHEDRRTGTILWRDREAARRLEIPKIPYVRPEPAPGIPEGAACFVHASILEWLLACHVTRRLAAGDRSVLRGERPTPMQRAFCKLTRAWNPAREQLQDILLFGTPDDPRENALLLISGDRTVTSSPDQPWQLAGLRLPHADLREACFAHADLTGADLRHAILVHADFTGADLSGARLTRANLHAAHCDGVTAIAADFDGAILDGVTWHDANLGRANFTASRASRDPQDFTGACVDGIETTGALWRPPHALSSGLAPTSDVPEEILGPQTFAWTREARWTRDGRHLVTVDSMGNVVVWYADPLQPLARWHATAYGPTHLELAADDRTLVVWTEGAAPRLFDRTTHTELHAGALAKLRIHSAVWARGTQRLALLTVDGVLWTWTPDQPPHELGRVTAGPATLHFLDDNRILIHAPAFGKFLVHDTHANLPVSESAIPIANPTDAGLMIVRSGGDRVALRDSHALAVHPLTSSAAIEPAVVRTTTPDRLGDGNAIDWSPNGAWIAVALQRGPCLWNVSRSQWSHFFQRSASWWSCLRFSPDSRRLAGVSEGGDLVVWDTLTGCALDPRPSSGHWIQASGLAVPRQTILVAVAEGVRRIDTSTLRPGRTTAYREAVEFSVAVAPDAAAFVTAVDRKLVLTTIDPDQKVVLDLSVRADDAAWDRCHFTCDGGFVVCRISDGDRQELAAWDRTGRRVFSATLEKGMLYQSHTVAITHGLGICGGQTQHGAGILDLYCNGTHRQIAHPGLSIYSLALDSEERLLASAAHGNRIFLWDLPGCISGAAVAPISEFNTDWQLIDQLRFAPHGRLLAAASGDSVYLHDCDARRPVHKFSGHGFRVHSVGFSADGRHLLAGDYSGQLHVWSIASGVRVACFHLTANAMIASRGGRGCVVDGKTDLAGWFGRIGDTCHPLAAFPGAIVTPGELAAALPWDG